MIIDRVLARWGRWSCGKWNVKRKAQIAAFASGEPGEQAAIF